MTTTPHETLTETATEQHPSNLPPPDDPFRYGWRFVSRVVNGEEQFEQVPLTLEDVLHPQMEDHIMHNDHHSIICAYLYTMLNDYLTTTPGAVVLFDVGLDLGLPGVRPICPDIMVIFGVRERRSWGIFEVAEEATHPSLVIEVTSRHNRHHDIGTRDLANAPKFHWYEQVGVETYLVVDNARRKEGYPPALYGFQLTPDGTYAPLPANDDGWLWLNPVGLWVGQKGDSVMLYHTTGQELEERSAAIARANTAEAMLAQERTEREEVEAMLAQERTEREEAEEHARRLAERLRKLGIDPDADDE